MHKDGNVAFAGVPAVQAAAASAVAAAAQSYPLALLSHWVALLTAAAASLDPRGVDLIQALPLQHAPFESKPCTCCFRADPWRCLCFPKELYRYYSVRTVAAFSICPLGARVLLRSGFRLWPTSTLLEPVFTLQGPI